VSDEDDSDALLCPSARCVEGAVLLGIVGTSGKVGYVRPQVRVDAEFVEKARRGRTPEKRFRFAEPCVEGRCRHWTGARCGVIDTVLGHQREGSLPSQERPLPACSIRPSCRWFAQAGAQACSACPFVVTNLLDDGTEERTALLTAAAVASLTSAESRLGERGAV
jgi:hypothetical protein